MDWIFIITCYMKCYMTGYAYVTKDWIMSYSR